MKPARLAFWGGVVIVVSVAITLINSLPTFADAIVEAGSAVLFVIAGRKSTDWF